MLAEKNTAGLILKYIYVNYFLLFLLHLVCFDGTVATIAFSLAPILSFTMYRFIISFSISAPLFIFSSFKTANTTTKDAVYTFFFTSIFLQIVQNRS